MRFLILALALFLAAPASAHTQWTFIEKTDALQSDAVIATATPINGLVFKVPALQRTIARCQIIGTSTVATTGIQIGLTASTGAGESMVFRIVTPLTAATSLTESFVATGGESGSTDAIVTVPNLITLDLYLLSGATGGTVQLVFNPETANSVSVLPGSYCAYSGSN